VEFHTAISQYELSQILEPLSFGPDIVCTWRVLFVMFLGLCRKCQKEIVTPLWINKTFIQMKGMTSDLKDQTYTIFKNYSGISHPCSSWDAPSAV
jgi:hypothetical protein